MPSRPARGPLPNGHVRRFEGGTVDNWAVRYFSALVGARKLVGAGLHAS